MTHSFTLPLPETVAVMFTMYLLPSMVDCTLSARSFSFAVGDGLGLRVGAFVGDGFGAAAGLALGDGAALSEGAGLGDALAVADGELTSTAAGAASGPLGRERAYAPAAPTTASATSPINVLRSAGAIGCRAWSSIAVPVP
ncbi:hypothetical protein CS0771_31010 [Catellatospora sp. IY07-71]|nr:hypothetical protein CS0771_31010 [Catellatospora sp. IY07-71]